MTGIYMVSAQKPTAVTHSILGRVTSETDLNLIICKSTLLEIYKVTKEGLKFIRQIGLWGVVDTLNILKCKNDKKDNVLITTYKHDIMILSCEKNADGSTYDVITRAHGDFKDVVPRVSTTSTITIVDPIRQLIAIKCYDGVLKLIPANMITGDNKTLNTSNLRMEDLNVIDMKFLHGCSNSTIALLAKESTKLTLKVYEYESMSKELSNLLWKKDINDNHAMLIPIPEPYGGVIVVGTQLVTYYGHSSNDIVQKSPPLLSQGEISSFAPIDPNGQRFLLANSRGQLYLMLLIDQSSNSNKITDIRFELLGETAVADNITYIDNGVVFIGSKIGDSQLVKLVENPNDQGSFVNTLETYTNLGPILDMLVVDIEKQGQGQLITCSGSSKNGSLRIIRSGIGIHESANIELPGVKAIWPLKMASSEFDDHLVLSFYTYTKVFSFFDDEFEDVEPDGFDLNSHTVHCATVAHNQILQITSTAARLIKPSTESPEQVSSRLICEWKVPEGELISVATSNAHECLIAFKNQLNYLLIHDGSIEFIRSKSLVHEIACLDIAPLNGKSNADMCAVGLWTDISARILTLPTLEQLVHEELKGEVIPRSILIENLEGLPHLFVSLGDGSVISYVISYNNSNLNVSGMPCQLTERRKVVLGTQPTILKKFVSEKSSSISDQEDGNNSVNSIFACSDRPSVISSANRKLVYSSVNLKQVDYMCQLNSKAYPNSLALLTGGGVLRIGSMDSIQKLHIRSVPINESVRRIAYQSETKTFAVTTMRMEGLSSSSPTGASFVASNTSSSFRPLLPSASTQCPNQYICKAGVLQPIDVATTTPAAEPTASTSSKHTILDNPEVSASSSHQFNGQFDTQLVNSMLILDQNTFEVLHSVQFQPNEYALSVTSLSFDQSIFDNPTSAAASTVQPEFYYVVGCCNVVEDESEPKKGRILVFKYSRVDNKLSLVCEKEIRGAPYCLLSYQGNKLLATVSNSIKLFEFNKKDHQLSLLASYSDNVFLTHLKCKSDFILVGDLMKSCTVLNYRQDNKTFEVVAADYTPVWLSSLEIVDDDNFLMSDSFLNVISLKKDSGQSNEDERKWLQNHGCIHLGEQINVFRHGSLGMQESMSAAAVSSAASANKDLNASVWQQQNELLNTHVHGSILAGTVNGSIILFTQLSSQLYKILNELQTRLAGFLVTAGKISYSKWRDFESEKRVETCKYFIDGDLIESFLELTQTEAANLVKDLKIDGSNIGHNGEEFSVSYFNKLIEELSRLH